jgi:starvation-inducible outer membrane lipoprotein
MIGIYPHGNEDMVAACCTIPQEIPGTSDTHEERIARMRTEFKYVQRHHAIGVALSD